MAHRGCMASLPHRRVVVTPTSEPALGSEAMGQPPSPDIVGCEFLQKAEQLVDPSPDDRMQVGGEAVPVLLGGSLSGSQRGEGLSDLGHGEADALCCLDHRNTAARIGEEAPVIVFGPLAG